MIVLTLIAALVGYAGYLQVGGGDEGADSAISEPGAPETGEPAGGQLAAGDGAGTTETGGRGIPFAVDDSVPFPTSPSGAPLTVLTLGDSVAGNMHQALKSYRTADLTPVSIASGGCGLFDAVRARAGNGWVMNAEEKGCGEWKDKLRTIGAEKRPDVIVVHNKWDMEDQFFDGSWIAPCQDVWTKQYRSQLELLASIRDEMPTKPLILISNDRPRPWSKTMTAERVGCKSDVEEAVFAAHPGMARLDLWAAVCPGGSCVTELPSGEALYADDRVHFTEAGKQLMAPWIQEQIAMHVTA